jgi:predicted glycosyltransferase
MKNKGHQVLFTVRDKEFEIRLLKQYELEYISFGKHRKSKTGKIWGLFFFTLKLWLVSVKFKPDIYFSHGSTYAALASWFFRKPHISMEDTGNREQVRLYKPFTEAILTSKSFHLKYGEKQIFYDGFHEIAYLHPKYFTPENSIFELLGIEKDRPYSILRFISWKATHDVGQKGLTLSYKIHLVNELSKFGEVFISSENDLPVELEKYKISIPPERMHDVLYFANLFVGEGATMASECAMLGTPAIYVNTIEAGTIDEQEKLGLLAHFRDNNGVLEEAVSILTDKSKRNKLKENHKIFISGLIDLTLFMVWFIEQWPESFRLMKENPDYQNRFK